MVDEQEGPQEPLSERERHVAALAGYKSLAGQVTVSEADVQGYEPDLYQLALEALRATQAAAHRRRTVEGAKEA